MMQRKVSGGESADKYGPRCLWGVDFVLKLSKTLKIMG